MVSLQNAYYIANAYDKNRNGILENRELKFNPYARQITDKNRDGVVTVNECAYSLMRGDVYISTNKKVYPTAYQYTQPSYNNTLYPYYPYQPYFPTDSNINPVSSTLVGATLGGAIGALVKGVVGLKTGAIIGGAIGLVSGLVA